MINRLISNDILKRLVWNDRVNQLISKFELNRFIWNDKPRLSRMINRFTSSDRLNRLSWMIKSTFLECWIKSIYLEWKTRLSRMINRLISNDRLNGQISNYKWNRLVSNDTFFATSISITHMLVRHIIGCCTNLSPDVCYVRVWLRQTVLTLANKTHLLTS